MSYDLEIWTVRPDLPIDALPKSSAWKGAGDRHSYEQASWQLVLDGPDPVEPEDFPPGLEAQMPGIGHLFRLTLEPLGAPEAAYKLASQAAAAVAKACHGVVYDPQEGSYTTPRGLKRFEPKVRESRVSLLEMTWWFDTPVFDREESIRAFLGLLGELLPEALPRRYGRYEPARFKLEEQGIDHLVEFLVAESESDGCPVWFPQRPVASLAVKHWPDKRPPVSWGHRCHSLVIAFEATALGQPGWNTALRRVWRRLTHFVSPFYGDVRTFDNWICRGGHYGADGQTEYRLVGGWSGLPPGPAHAIVIGPPYDALWREAVAIGKQEGGLWFLDTPIWTKPHQVAVRVPPEMALIPMPNDHTWRPSMTPQLPSVWPF